MKEGNCSTFCKPHSNLATLCGSFTLCVKGTQHPLLGHSCLVECIAIFQTYLYINSWIWIAFPVEHVSDNVILGAVFFSGFWFEWGVSVWSHIILCFTLHVAVCVILSDQMQGTVTLRNISTSTSGLYQCTSSNAIGKSTCLLNLEVARKYTPLLWRPCHTVIVVYRQPDTLLTYGWVGAHL